MIMTHYELFQLTTFSHWCFAFIVFTVLIFRCLHIRHCMLLNTINVLYYIVLHCNQCVNQSINQLANQVVTQSVNQLFNNAVRTRGAEIK